MARNYFFDDNNIYTHFIDYPDGVQAPNATLTSPLDLEQCKWKYNKELNQWTPLTLQQRLEALMVDKFENINNQRAYLIYKGFPHTFANGTTTVIQTRAEKDLIAILGTTVTAMFMLQQGMTNKIPFRSADDVTHMLDPQEAVMLGMSIQQQVAGVYQKSWDKKEELKACKTVQELESIDIDITGN